MKTLFSFILVVFCTGLWAQPQSWVDIPIQEAPIKPDRVRILDSRGQLILEQAHFQVYKNSISIKDFLVGIYFIIFDVENRSYSTKLIKQ